MERALMAVEEKVAMQPPLVMHQGMLPWRDPVRTARGTHMLPFLTVTSTPDPVNSWFTGGSVSMKQERTHDAASQISGRVHRIGSSGRRRSRTRSGRDHRMEDDHRLPTRSALLLDRPGFADRLRRSGARHERRTTGHQGLPCRRTGTGIRRVRCRTPGNRAMQWLGQLLRCRQGARGAVLRCRAVRHVDSGAECLVLHRRRARPVAGGL